MIRIKHFGDDDHRHKPMQTVVTNKKDLRAYSHTITMSGQVIAVLSTGLALLNEMHILSKITDDLNVAEELVDTLLPAIEGLDKHLTAITRERGEA